jgi:hypothetical protein
MIDPAAAIGGAAVGAGLVLVVAGLRPPVPDLRSTLWYLDGRLPARRAPAPSSSADPGEREVMSGATPVGRWAARRGRRCAAWLADRPTDAAISGPVGVLRLSRLAGDLALVGETLDLLLVRKAGYAVLGMVFPSVAVASFGVLGLRLPWTLPAFAAVVVAAVLFMVPDADVRARAAKVRGELRRAVCIYIDLVALERAADAGPVEALERAAGLDDAPAFGRIRNALTRAQLDGVPPWQGLHTLADTTGVTELADLADIMASSGRQGAAVYASLRARATSLRSAITAEDAASANSASERMVIPVALLGLIFMAVIAFPALARIAFTT